MVGSSADIEDLNHFRCPCWRLECLANISFEATKGALKDLGRMETEEVENHTTSWQRKYFHTNSPSAPEAKAYLIPAAGRSEPLISCQKGIRQWFWLPGNRQKKIPIAFQNQVDLQFNEPVEAD